MDLSLSIRFSNLPNNSQLEMKQRSGPREEEAVTIAVQSESGSRVQGQFLSSESLYSVLSGTIGIPVPKRGQDIVCIYMRREVIGESLLKTTTLKSLGLTSGSAMLRVIIRDADALKTQAHVEDLKFKKPAAGPSKTDEVVADVKQNVSKFGKSLKKMVSGVFDSVTSSAAESQPVAQKKSPSPKEHSPPPKPKPQPSKSKQPKAESSLTEPAAAECLDINWLGERDALVFDMQDMAKWRSVAKQEDVSDDFFEHTQDDVILMYSDLKQRVREMDDRPLETAALREKKRSQTRYTKTVLRICFPADGLVIQATFLPTDSIETVINFVRKYIRDQNKEFYLYTTPPKQILSSQDILVKKQLIPAAIIHFGQSDVNEAVLVPHLKSQITSFNAIAAATAELRRQIAVRREEAEVAGSVQEAAAPDPEVIQNPATGQEQKVPKWFKKT